MRLNGTSVDLLIRWSFLQKEINGTTKDQRNIFFGNLMKKVNVPLIFFVHLLEILHLFLEKHCLTPLSFWILPSANLLPQPTLALNQTQTRAPCEAGALILALPTMLILHQKVGFFLCFKFSGKPLFLKFVCQFYLF